MSEVTDYVESLAGPAHDAVSGVVERARTIVPDATEGTSYGMPALRYRGSPLISVVETKKHIGVYPFSPPVIEMLADELEGFHVTKGSIGFTPDRPLPADLVDRLVTLRRDEIDAMRAR